MAKLFNGQRVMITTKITDMASADLFCFEQGDICVVKKIYRETTKTTYYLLERLSDKTIQAVCERHIQVCD